VAELICPVCKNGVQAGDAECGTCHSNILGLATAAVASPTVEAPAPTDADECPNTVVRCGDPGCGAVQDDPLAERCGHCDRPLSAGGPGQVPVLLLPWGTPVLGDGERLELGRGVGPYADQLEQVPTVSFDHASVTRVGNELVLMDHDSTNGTFVDGVRLEPRVARSLRAGEVVRLSRAFSFPVVTPA
jgi:hypothetical protein